MVGIIFAILMILNLGTASLSDPCISNPVISCNEEISAPCGTSADHTATTHQEHCTSHCSHPIPFLNQELPMDQSSPQKSEIISDLICDASTVLEGPFRPPLS